MRLYYLEMKRLIRTKSVWILMIAMVVLAAVMAYVPVTFIRAYKTDAGNVQAVTGVQAVKISKETRKDMEGEVTEEKIRQAIRVLNEMYQEYGSSFMEEVSADVYAEKIYPIMPVLNVIEQVLVPDGKNLYNMETFDVKEEDAATIYEKYREEIQGLSQNPELVKEMQKISGSVKTPFTYESGMTLETVDYYTIYLFLVMFAFIVIASPVYAAEYQTGADDVIRCTKNGRVRIAVTKISSHIYLGCGYICGKFIDLCGSTLYSLRRQRFWNFHSDGICLLPPGTDNWKHVKTSDCRWSVVHTGNCKFCAIFVFKM